jgi:uncharacterized Zn-binding protein involved in type VI secretion
MPACAKDGDKCTGHDSHAPRTNTSSSSTVFVNGKGILRESDTWENHCDSGGHNCHTSFLETGQESTTVFANGHAVARLGDHISGNGCLSSIAVGSGNVFVGG